MSKTETDKTVKKLIKLLDKHVSKRKSGKIFKKDTNIVAKKLNEEARRIAKLEKRKVRDVQDEIIKKFNFLMVVQ